MKKILIASTNPGKITEIKIGLQELEKQEIKILTLNDVIVGDKEPGVKYRRWLDYEASDQNYITTCQSIFCVKTCELLHYFLTSAKCQL